MPVIYSGLNKVLYMIEIDAGWRLTRTTTIEINGYEASRFSEALDTPFARKMNSKVLIRHMGIVVPKEWIKPND